MNEDQSGVRLNENVVCDVCGVFGAYEVGERRLCATCYEGSGSCCPEFGKDDLWAQTDKQTG